MQHIQIHHSLYQLLIHLLYDGVDPEHGHIFKEVTGENKGYICFPDQISPSVLDQNALIEWLSSEHNQQTTLKTYDYKNI